ncbi:hypothetical protein PP2015_3593 [Pseudoalteromonas phenolica]|uniref:Porin domain-containing protein n=2 Tax=Pseudoalteromonas phenolica TaxID=161398 RepID=A0A0S2K7Q5_9GAMM|nr:hypothetical protein PP2015_3593 [Pseudoalteromonas phenolica]
MMAIINIGADSVASNAQISFLDIDITYSCKECSYKYGKCIWLRQVAKLRYHYCSVVVYLGHIMRQLSYLLFAPCITISANAIAEVGYAGGFWINYSYNENSYDTNLGDQALIFYLDKKNDKHSPWHYSAEFRLGPGGFSDPDNNTSGSDYVLHKAWVSYDFSEAHKLVMGKSQLPFAWKTANFWPGDMFLAAYGDQMDVGLKYQGSFSNATVQIAYYPRDDWRSTSTDSTDDNRHWGSRHTYRKLNTLVGDFQWHISSSHTLGFSAQNAELEEFVTGKKQTDGEHQAMAAYYQGQFESLSVKLSYIDGERQLPQAYYIANNLPNEIKNTRYNTEVSYQVGDWTFLVDVTLAKSNTQGGVNSTVSAWAPGVRYNYGPGWVYLEYLNQDAWFDRDMRINKGDFAAWYLTLDYYW